MIKAGSIYKGMFLDWRGEPTLVVDKEFFNPGKGAAVVRLKLKGLKSGHVVREVLKTDVRVEEVQVDHHRVQFLYRAGQSFIFLDPKTYEQIEVGEKVIGENDNFIREGKEYVLSIWGEETVGISLPKKLTFTIAQTEGAAKGDTVTGGSKLAVMDNGLKVKVPLFIKKGEKIIVSTETGEYVSRKN